MKIAAAELRSDLLTFLVLIENDYIYNLAYNRYTAIIEMLMDLYMCVKKCGITCTKHFAIYFPAICNCNIFWSYVLVLLHEYFFKVTY